MWVQAFPSLVVRAQTVWDTCLVEEVATFKCLEPIFENIVTVIMSLAGVALFIMVVMSGFSFLFSGGDPKKLEQAKGAFSNAIIGLVVIVSAFLILRIIGVFTGTESIITKFEVPIQ